MNTEKHLLVLFKLATVFLCFSIAGTILGFIAMVSGETPAVFIICASSSLIFYFSMLFLSIIADFYDAVVNKKIRLSISRFAKPKTMNMPKSEDTDSEEQ